jgi:hypothetical protein
LEPTVRAVGLTLAVLGAIGVFAARADAQPEPGRERIDFTAYTLRGQAAQIGIGASAYGVIDELTVGTYVVPWLASPLLGAPMVTAFVKGRDWLRGPVAVSLRAGVVYLNASELSDALSSSDDASARIWMVPLELSGSLLVSPAFTQSLQLTWVHIDVDGESGAEVDVGFGAAAAASSASLSSLSELRVSSVTSLTLRMNVLLGYSNVAIDGQLERNGTQVTADLGEDSDRSDFVANFIPGVAFHWAHVGLHLGVGIGAPWLPIAGIPIHTTTVVPDLDFYVRF